MPVLSDGRGCHSFTRMMETMLERGEACNHMYPVQHGYYVRHCWQCGYNGPNGQNTDNRTILLNVRRRNIDFAQYFQGVRVSRMLPI